eukprot:3808927-Prorocentrum_lima.AAC.1
MYVYLCVYGDVPKLPVYHRAEENELFGGSCPPHGGGKRWVSHPEAWALSRGSNTLDVGCGGSRRKLEL